MLRALGDANGIVDIAQTIQQNGELIAAKTRRRIAGTQARFQAARYGNQKFIARFVSQIIVHAFEFIEVKKQHCEQMIVPLGAMKRAI